MTLDEYIEQHCAEYAASLEQLASASVNDKVIYDMAGLVEHLRSLYRVRRSAFTPSLLEKIKRFLEPGSNPITVEPLDEKVEGPSGGFQTGKYYLSQRGVFRVVEAKPFPSIDPPLYPKCDTHFYASYMLRRHNELIDLINAPMRELRFANVYAREFILPKDTAEAEIAHLTEQYNLMIEANHREFLRTHEKPYLGTQPTTKRLRVTRCHSCKTGLTNELYKECLACGWIICSCGACGCVFLDFEQIHSQEVPVRKQL